MSDQQRSGASTPEQEKRMKPETTPHIDAIRERLKAATAWPWVAYRMTHEDRGDDFTPEEVGEYVKNSVIKSAAESGSNQFLFVSAQQADGPADVCHVGNGPTSPQNAVFIANAPEDIAYLLSRIDTLAASPSPPMTQEPTMVAALKQSEARIYPDANFERYLDDVTGTLIELVEDAANECDEHEAATIRQAVEAIGHLRRSRDELRRDMERIGLAYKSAPLAPPETCEWREMVDSLLAFGLQEKDEATTSRNREKYLEMSGWVAALQRVLSLSSGGTPKGESK